MHSTIIRRPLVTEKNTFRAQALNEYAFEVDVAANRIEIKAAIEKLFNVKVVRVNTMVGRKEAKKMGKFPGPRRLWKKAIVKLQEGDKFDFIAT